MRSDTELLSEIGDEIKRDVQQIVIPTLFRRHV